jgi:hypothetical protein
LGQAVNDDMRCCRIFLRPQNVSLEEKTKRPKVSGQANTLLVPAKNPYNRDLGHVTPSNEGAEGLKMISLLTSLLLFCAVIYLARLDFVDLQADD